MTLLYNLIFETYLQPFASNLLKTKRYILKINCNLLKTNIPNYLGYIMCHAVFIHVLFFFKCLHIISLSKDHNNIVTIFKLSFSFLNLKLIINFIFLNNVKI